LGKNKENKSKLANKSQEEDDFLDKKSEFNDEDIPASKKLIQGITYRKLKPEVKLTLEKVVYQLELVAKTLQLMETRVMDSEDKLQEIMTYIKYSDLEFVSTFFVIQN
jgi:hypothetical protein